MTRISYMDGQTDTQIHGQTDGLIPVYPRKHSFCWIIKGGNTLEVSYSILNLDHNL